MASVNKVVLVGNVGRDPESRSLGSGGKVVQFSVATSEAWTDKGSGERKERTQWHRVVIWNEKVGEVAERYLKKGSKVYIEGALETRKYTDQSGAERETTEVVLRPYRGEMVLLSERQGGDSAGSRSAAPAGASGGWDAPASAPARRPAQAARPAADSSLDDEIPF